MEEKSTGELLNILTSTHTQKELNHYLLEHAKSEEDLSFHRLFCQLMEEKGLVRADVIRDSTLDRTYAYQILNGTRTPGRDKVLALCVAAGFSLKETRRLLERARESGLYARSSRDAILIFGIEHGLDVMRINEMLADKGEKILE